MEVEKILTRECRNCKPKTKRRYDREYWQSYYVKNREKVIARSKKYKQDNREKMLLYYRQRYRNDQALILSYIKERYREAKLKIFELLGGAKCVRCGFADVRALQLDHINGGGSKERKVYGNGSTRNLMHYYANNPEISKRSLQVLCANCNWIKRVENEEV